MDELVQQAGRLADELHRANEGGSTLNWILAVLVGIFLAIVLQIGLEALKLAWLLARTRRIDREEEEARQEELKS